jgi:hypothetical protein
MKKPLAGFGSYSSVSSGAGGVSSTHARFSSSQRYKELLDSTCASVRVGAGPSGDSQSAVSSTRVHDSNGFGAMKALSSAL